MTTGLICVRHAHPRDAAALAIVYEAAWREAYQGLIPGLVLERMILRRGPLWWRTTIERGRPLAVLDTGEAIAGYVSYGRCRNAGLPAKGEIDELYLAPEYQGVGFGRRLFRAACNDLADRKRRPIVVWALSENERACDFYAHLGGEILMETVETIGKAPLAKTAFLFD